MEFLLGPYGVQSYSDQISRWILDFSNLSSEIGAFTPNVYTPLHRLV